MYKGIVQKKNKRTNLTFLSKKINSLQNQQRKNGNIYIELAQKPYYLTTL